MNLDSDEYKQDEEFMEKVRSGSNDVSDYLIYEDWDQGNYPGNTYVMYLLDKGYDPVKVAEEVHKVWNDAHEVRRKATMDLLDRIGEDTTPKKVVTYEVNGEKRSYRIENDTVDYVRDCLEELSDKKAPDSALWGIENTLDSRGLSNLDVYRERLKNGFYEKKPKTINLLAGEGSTKTTNVDKAYRFLEKELGPRSKITDDEIIDLVGMEAQVFYHLTDKEMDAIVKAYKQS